MVCGFLAFFFQRPTKMDHHTVRAKREIYHTPHGDTAAAASKQERNSSSDAMPEIICDRLLVFCVNFDVLQRFFSALC